MSEWKTSACILCECNCGIKVQTGGEGDREIVRIRGDEDHPASQGYLCQKASGLNHYQNGTDRLLAPLRRREDGSFEEIDWDTAIREVAAKLAAVRDTHGGDKIFYYGGGGQGNHLPGAYSGATRKVLGNAYRSSALAQEKTGEFWVNGQMFNTHVRGDFEHCDVAVFVGKNPWHSHGLPRARAWLREFSKDPGKTMIVIDPVVSETAKLAEIHLQVKPGTDAWLLAAMVAMLLQQGKYRADWLAQHTQGFEEIRAAFGDIPVEQYLAHAGIPLATAQAAVDAIAGAEGAAFFEDLGTQMNRHSTLVSYLEKLVWLLCGHLARPGGQVSSAYLTNIAGSGRATRKSPVAGAPIISGLVPCNVIAEEILTDHPDRYRAMIVEASNPVHSLADSQRMAEALESLECVVVIDIAMTETARHADYVLPVATQYEKWEATFFNFEFPDNYFHLRKPLFDAPAGVHRGGDSRPPGGGPGRNARGPLRGADDAAGNGRAQRLPGSLYRRPRGRPAAVRRGARGPVPHAGPESTGGRGHWRGAVAPVPGPRHARWRLAGAGGLRRQPPGGGGCPVRRHYQQSLRRGVRQR